MTYSQKHPGQEMDHPKERAGPVPSTTVPVVGTDLAVCPADTSAIPKAKVPHTAPQLNAPTGPLEDTEDPPLTGTAGEV